MVYNVITTILISIQAPPFNRTHPRRQRRRHGRQPGRTSHERRQSGAAGGTICQLTYTIIKCRYRRNRIWKIPFALEKICFLILWFCCTRAFFGPPQCKIEVLFSWQLFCPVLIEAFNLSMLVILFIILPQSIYYSLICRWINCTTLVQVQLSNCFRKVRIDFQVST